MKRSHVFDVDADFDVTCDVTKAELLPDGRRLIRGVASGVLEDRDGERVSARAIAQMAAQPVKGMKLVAETAGHVQNWTNEIGDIAELRVDPETQELVADAILPPEGKDPLADKAWTRLNEPGSKLGYSIGGKLRKAYQELVEGPGGVRKRKVLDGIQLRHILLTDRPAYAPSIVQAVAKTASSVVFDEAIELYDVDPADEMRDALEIAKAAKQPLDDPEQPSGEAPQAAEAAPEAAPEGAPAADGEAPPDDPASAPPAGTADTSAQQPTDAQAAQGLPLSNRHLSCPNCGEEFAAPLPATGPLNADGSQEPGTTPDGGDTAKTHKETTMDVKAELAKIQGLLEDVAKTVTGEPTTPEAEVAKAATEDTPSELERLIAVSHRSNADRLDSVEKQSKEGFELVAKAVQGLAERVAEMPQGRRSHAAAFAAREKPNAGGVEVAKTTTDDEVQKTAEQLAEAGDLHGALKLRNEQLYGVR